MTNPAAPTVEQVVANITRSLNGQLPPAIQHAVTVMPEMVLRHAQDSAFAMPAEGGALSNETRTLIYLGIALATGSRACIEAMTNKAQGLGIESAKLLETFRIARYAEATRVLGNAEILFAKLNDPQV
ncbi:MAG: carboxymuconolactone decarboxylase family protein [Propionibacterium sp.]|nr:carboxymuconolactone decarboxylase family protein [Propionibacterium sp.]